MFSKIKRRYADLRFGYAQVGILIGLANFLLLAYNFTNAKEISISRNKTKWNGTITTLSRYA